MGTDITVYDRFDKPGEMIERLGKSILQSNMFGCENASQGQILALECAARRCPPMALAERYHIIHGHLSMASDAMLADFRTKCKGTHKVIERSPEKASIELSLDKTKKTFTLTWDEAKEEPFVYTGKESDVVQALLNGGQSKLRLKPKYSTPRSRMQMLWARVVSDGVRAMAPEVVAGWYTPEEISDFGGHDNVPSSGPDVLPVDKTLVEAATPQKPVKLNAETGADGDVMFDDDPCGEEYATRIKRLAETAKWEPEQLVEILKEHGVRRVAELPLKHAEQLIRDLECVVQDADCPFG